MRVLGHIHTFNSEDVIGPCLEALLHQTYPLEEILIVDNGSTDGTLAGPLPERVTVVQHDANVGPGGAVNTGFRYAQSKQFDWIWVFDADTTPHRDALERLLQLYDRLLAEGAPHIGVLSSRVATPISPMIYCSLTPSGPRPVSVPAGQDYCDSDTALWSGSLFNLRAVTAVGYPLAGRLGYWEQLGFDMGDIEFCYRLRRAGYRVLVHQHSVIDHTLGSPRQVSILGRTFSTSNHAPYRRHLIYRNLVYFWMHIYRDRRTVPMLLFLARRLTIASATIVLFESGRLRKLHAALRGAWDGLRRNMSSRY
jgi:rhamnosyltransferase